MDEQASQSQGLPVDAATIPGTLSLHDRADGCIDGGDLAFDGSHDEHVVHVFLSYSRKDFDRANWLRDRLMSKGFEVAIDTHGIEKGEPWRERLSQLVQASDCVLFLISPDSVKSAVCDWEINEAERLGKRILPVVIRRTPDADVPGRLQRLNYTFLDGKHDEAEFSSLVNALLTDIHWVREHTRLGQIAERWAQSGRPNDLLLRGKDIEAAQRWRDARPSSAPAPAPVCVELIASSRRGAAARQRTLLSALVVFTLFLAGAAGYAWFQRAHAIEQQHIAESNELSLRSDMARAAAPLDALVLAVQAYDRHRSSASIRTVRKSIDSVAMLRRLNGLAAASFSRNGQCIVALSNDGDVHVLDANTLGEVRRLAGRSRSLQNVQVSAGCRYVAGVDKSGNVTIWDEHGTGEPPTLNVKHAGDEVRFGRTERIMAEVGQGVISFYALPSLRLLSSMASSHVNADAIDFNASDTVAVVVQQDNRALVIDPATGAQKFVLDMREEAARLKPALGESDASVLSMAQIMDDGKSIVTSGYHALWKRWDLRTGKALGGAASPVPGYGTEWMRAMPGANVLVADEGGRGRLSWWDIDENNEATAPDADAHANLIETATLRQDGRLAATTSADQELMIWGSVEHRRLAAFGLGNSRPSITTFSADGKRLITYSRDGELVLWDAATVTPDGRLPVGRNGFNIAAFSESGARLVTLDLEGSADIWDVTRGSHIAKLGRLSTRFRHVAISDDGARVAAVGDDKTIQIWNGEDGTPIASYPGDFNYVTFDRSKTKIAVSSFDGLVSLIRLDDGHVDTARFQQQLTNAVTISPDGSEYVVTGNDGTAIIATAATGKARAILSIKPHSVPFRRAVYSPDGSRVITTHDDNVLRMWNAATGEPMGEFRGHKSGVSTAHVFDDGHLLLSSSDDHTVCLWSVDDQSLIRTFTVHAGQVMDAVPVASGDNVMSVDRDGALFSSRCLGCRSEEAAIQAARARLTAVASHSIVNR